LLRQDGTTGGVDCTAELSQYSIAGAFNDAATVRGVLIGSAIGDVVGFVITGWGMMQGLLNATAWSSLVIYGALALGAIYLLLAAPQRLTTASG